MSSTCRVAQLEIEISECLFHYNRSHNYRPNIYILRAKDDVGKYETLPTNTHMTRAAAAAAAAAACYFACCGGIGSGLLRVSLCLCL